MSCFVNNSEQTTNEIAQIKIAVKRVVSPRRSSGQGGMGGGEIDG